MDAPAPAWAWVMIGCTTGIAIGAFGTLLFFCWLLKKRREG